MLTAVVDYTVEGILVGEFWDFWFAGVSGAETMRFGLRILFSASPFFTATVNTFSILLYSAVLTVEEVSTFNSITRIYISNQSPNLCLGVKRGQEAGNGKQYI